MRFASERSLIPRLMPEAADIAAIELIPMIIAIWDAVVASKPKR